MTSQNYLNQPGDIMKLSMSEPTNAFTIPKTSAIAADLLKSAGKAANAMVGRKPTAKPRHFSGLSLKADERIRQQKELEKSS